MTDFQPTPASKRPAGRPKKPADYTRHPQAARLREFRTMYVNKSQTQAAKKLGIGQSSLAQYELGISPIPLVLLNKLVKDFQLNQEWLTMGSGKPLDKNPPKAGLVVDVNAIQLELVQLTKYLTFLQKQQEFMLKKMGEMEEKIAKLESAK